MKDALLFEIPKDPPRRLTKNEKKALYHCIRFFFYQEIEDYPDGKALVNLYSAMDKLKPKRRKKHESA